MKVNKGIIIQKTGKRVAIFDGEKSLLYNFNGTASFIFLAIKKGMEKEEIVKKLSSKYQISIADAIKDLGEFIEDLKNKKIVS